MSFAILFACGDQRCWGRAAPYLEKRFNLERVFLVTRPGGIKVLTGFDDLEINSVKREVEDYYDVVDRKIVTVAAAGHKGCARNLADANKQVEQLIACEELFRTWAIGNVQITRLFVHGETVDENPDPLFRPAQLPVPLLFAT